MAGYIGTKAVLLSTTAASVTGNADIGGDLTVDTSTLFVDSTNNRVGVGTSSPAVLLDVAGSSGQMFLQNTDATANGSHDFSVTALKPGTGFNNFNIAGYEVRFKIGGASTEAMRIDSSGNVGIGVASPQANMHVSDTGDTAIQITKQGSVAARVKTVAGALAIGVDGANGDTERMRIDGSGNVGIGVTPAAWVTTTTSRGAQFGRGASVFYSTDLAMSQFMGNAYQSASNTFNYLSNGYAGRYAYSDFDGNHTWYTAPSGTQGSTATFTERMRIDASGNLLVGATAFNSAQNGFGVSGNGWAFFTNSTGLGSIFRRNNATAAGDIIVFQNNTGATVGSITTTGSATAYNTSSDYRLKENVTLLSGAADRIAQIPVHRFNFIADPDKTVDGFLAHEVQAVVPEAVTGTKDAMRTEEYEVTPAVEATYDEDGNELTPYVPAVMGTREVPDYQGIDQSKLVPLLTAALQEALNEIAALKDRVAALEAV